MPQDSMPHDTGPDAAALALEMRDLVKDFAGVRALDRANLRVRRGSVHGLIGQNGAGKSTLIKLLAGIHAPDAGSIAVDGTEQPHLTPHRAEQLGVHFIHQDRLLVPTFTVAESLFLGAEPRRFGLPLLHGPRMRRRAVEVLRDTFDIVLPTDALVGELSAAQQQLVQITRALLNRPKVLVFDEPTAALVRREVDSLFGIVRRLRGQGITIVYISHYLHEIAEICDAVTVLRNGVDVGTVDPRTTPIAELVSMMVARDIHDMFPRRRGTPGAPVLSATGLGLAGAFADVSLTVRRGEIVGMTGLVGSGAKDLLRCLFGLQRADRGHIEIDGATLRGHSPAAAVAGGLALVPEDRRGHGVALSLSVRENATIAGLSRFARGPLIDVARERADVDRLIRELAIRTPHRDAMVRDLSGGNQQKVVLAKWLSRRSQLYLLDEPTVGVDVGAKVEIYRLIDELAGNGAGVLVLSTDLLELLGLCDRILVMYRGRIVFDVPAAETDSDALLLQATGAGGHADAA
jgi:ribose transport system ATP-binding protein